MGSEESEWEVLFSLTPVRSLPGQIVIYPVKDSWNDFGYKIKCKFDACLSGGKSHVRGQIFVGFLPPDDISDEEKGLFYEKRISLDNVLSEKSRKEFHVDEVPFYFTLLPDMSSYRKLVKSLGSQNAELLLLAVNDLVVFKQTQEEWVEDALSSEVFTHGFMRDSEPFFAFNNADSVLGGVEDEDFSVISQKLDLTFSLDGYVNQHEIKLRFSSGSLIPRRINILIGKNGLGKSQALRNFCRAALRYRDSKETLIDVERKDERPMISRLLAIATPGETDNTFPQERKKTQKLFYRRLNLTRNGRSGTSRSIGEALVQLVRNYDEIGALTRWGLFIGALEKVLPVDSIVIAQATGEYVSIRSLRQGGEGAKLSLWANIDRNADPRIQIMDNFYPLSSGQLTFFKICLLCCLYIENGSFVLMDEPETHMHPSVAS